MADLNIQALLQRINALPDSERDALLTSAQGGITTPPITANNTQGSGTFTLLSQTQASASSPTMSTSSTPPPASSATTTTCTTAPVMGAAPTMILPPRNTPAAGPTNPHPIGSLKFLGFKLPPVTPRSLQPYADFHNGKFDITNVKLKYLNLACQRACQTFVTMRAPENRIKILHSLAVYVAPLGEEGSDINHNRYFGFKGERKRRHDPPPVHFRLNLLTSVKCKVPLLDVVERHYGQDTHSTIIEPDGSDVPMELTRSLLIPTKWAAELVDVHPSPWEFLEFMRDKTNSWSATEQQAADFIFDWARAACGAANKSTKSSSQLGIDVPDFDRVNDNFDDWAEHRLVTTLGCKAVAANQGGSGGNGGSQPIYQFNMPTLPQPTLNQIDIAFNRGAEAHKRTTETSVVSGTKYTDKQMVHLLAFCGLSSRERGLLPAIWTSLQATKNWHDASVELTKWFSLYEDVGDIPVQFHKELVEDIRKLMFSLGPAPLAANAHRGITPLAFVLLSVDDENKLREDQDAYEGATSLTPAMMRAAKRRCPSVVFDFEKFDKLMIRYVKSGQKLFTERCAHFVECNSMRQVLMLMYRRNLGHLPPNTIAGLLWDVVADSAQFFYTFPSAEEFNATPQRNMPSSQLAVRYNLLSANLHVAAMDTPKAWLVAPPIFHGGKQQGLGRSRQEYGQFGGGAHGGANGGRGGVALETLAAAATTRVAVTNGRGIGSLNGKELTRRNATWTCMPCWVP